MSDRKRCTECRRRFTPSVTAKARQLVCGASCRQSRRNRLARARRLEDLAATRSEERERQARHRASGRREWRPCAEAGHGSCAGRAEAPCHELASRRKLLNSQHEIRKIVARAASLSRASFEHGLRAIAADLGWIGDWRRVDGGHNAGAVTDQLQRPKYQ